METKTSKSVPKTRTETRPPLFEKRPVTDVKAFLDSLPRFTDEETQLLETAIIEDRTLRRTFMENKT